jgi:hypothetical protein
MENVKCMDYDSMGDCGRFPRIRVKKTISVRERIVNFLLSLIDRFQFNK